MVNCVRDYAWTRQRSGGHVGEKPRVHTLGNFAVAGGRFCPAPGGFSVGSGGSLRTPIGVADASLKLASRAPIGATRSDDGRSPQVGLVGGSL